MDIDLYIYQADTSKSLALQYADAGVQAGFPSPAQDYMCRSIDLNELLINHPATTFYARVSGDSMSGEGIEENDILIVDRSIEPENGDLAVCCLDGEFTLKRLNLSTPGMILLMPSNPHYRPIEIKPDRDFTVWGVVLYTIKANRRPKRRGKW